jgi:hypothetical protein
MRGLLGVVRCGRHFYSGRSGSNSLQIRTLEQKLVDGGAVTIPHARLTPVIVVDSTAIVCEVLSRLGADDTLALARPFESFQGWLVPRLRSYSALGRLHIRQLTSRNAPQALAVIFPDSA